MKLRIARELYDVIHRCHNEWQQSRGLRYNNLIIDMLRNPLAQDAQNWYEIHIKKRLVEVPDHLRCERHFSSELAVRRFRGQFVPRPCEICGFERAPNAAHIIPKAYGGPDDDWNLIHLCANHHYLFDRGLLEPEEYNAINWNDKGAEAMYFAEKIRLLQHKQHWSIRR